MGARYRARLFNTFGVRTGAFPAIPCSNMNPKHDAQNNTVHLHMHQLWLLSSFIAVVELQPLFSQDVSHMCTRQQQLATLQGTRVQQNV